MTTAASQLHGDTPASYESSKTTMRRYCWIGIGTLAIMYLLPFGLLRLPGFQRWSGSEYGPILEYSFTASKVNADVVIFGDSSALFGIDPNQLSSMLHVKAVNLPNTIGNLPVLDDMPLRQYLRSNQPPRLLVFYFAPWNLDYMSSKRTQLYEGEELLVRHGSLTDLTRFSESHMSEMLSFPFRFYSANKLSVSISRLRHRHVKLPIDVAMGHVPLNFPPEKLLRAQCHIPETLLSETQADAVIALRDKYENDGMPIMVFIAPIPACDNADDPIQISYTEISADHPMRMDPTQYEDDGYYCHLNSTGVPAATANLATAISKRLETHGSDGSRERP